MRRLLILILALSPVLIAVSACEPTCYDQVLRDGTVLHECR